LSELYGRIVCREKNQSGIGKREKGGRECTKMAAPLAEADNPGQLEGPGVGGRGVRLSGSKIMWKWMWKWKWMGFGEGWLYVVRRR